MNTRNSRQRSSAASVGVYTVHEAALHFAKHWKNAKARIISLYNARQADKSRKYGAPRIPMRNLAFWTSASTAFEEQVTVTGW